MARTEKTHKLIREIEIAKRDNDKRFKIYMEWSPVELPDELFDWPGLEELELQMYSGPLAGLRHMEGLRKLTMAGGRISPDLAEVTQLQHFSMTHGLLKAMPEISLLTSIPSIHISGYECI